VPIPPRPLADEAVLLAAEVVLAIPPAPPVRRLLL